MDTMHTLVILIDTLDLGGQETQAILLYQRLKKSSSYKVKLLVLSGNKSPLRLIPASHNFDETDEIYYLHPSPVYLRLFRASSLLTSFGEPVILIAFGATATLFGFALKLLLRSPKYIPFERSDIQLAYPFIRYIMLLACYRFADHLFSNNLKSYFRLTAIKPGRTYYLPNILVHQVTDSSTSLCSSLSSGLRHSSRRLIFIGRLGREKNIITVLQSMSQIVQYNISLHIYGRFDERLSKASKFLLENLIQELPNVIYHGQVSDKSVIYDRSTYLVSVSSYEGFPNVVLEALSFGIPVIAYPSGDIPAILLHGYNGILLSSICSTDLSRSILNAFQIDSRSYSIMSANCLRSVEKYSSTHIIPAYSAAFKSVTGSFY